MQAPLRHRSVLGMPWVSPMLAESYPVPFDNPNYLFEVKWDGYRCLAYLCQNQALLYSRSGHSLLETFPHLGNICRHLHFGKSKRVTLDGEIISFQDGKVSFHALSSAPQKAVYVAFDLLYNDEVSLLKVPLEERRGLLEEVIDQGDIISISYGVRGMGKTLFSWVKEKELEGIMAKTVRGFYHPGTRSKEWIKIRNVQEGEFHVVGYIPSPGRKIGSLIIAEKTPGPGNTTYFRVRGRVSSGLSSKTEEELIYLLGKGGDDPLNVLKGTLTRIERERARWVEPRVRVVVNYTEMTADGRLRHPILREIKSSDTG